MNNTIVVGLQYGDEAKARVVDEISNKFDIVARFNGGDNAGHTVIINGIKTVLHLLPCGILSNKEVFIGSGCYVNPDMLMKEIEIIKSLGIDDGLIKVSGNCNIILNEHIDKDIKREALFKIGTTKRGIGPCAEDKYARRGYLFRTLVKHPKYSELAKYMVEPNYLVNKSNILFEGAQSTMLDINYGEYPYVTSSHCLAMDVGSGAGVSLLNKPVNVIGVFKPYVTKVGTGSYPTSIEESEPDLAAHIRAIGKEYGATTGRPRHIGWLDLDALKYAVELNGVTHLAMMKSDVLCGIPNLKIKLNNYLIPIKGWETLSDPSFNEYKRVIQMYTGVKINIVSYGPERGQNNKIDFLS